MTAEEKNPKKNVRKQEPDLKEKIAQLEAALAAKEDSHKAELEKIKADADDKYLRLYAEFDTFRRRSSEEKLDLVGSAAAETIKGLLPVLDDMERAMQMLESSSDEAAKEGTALIHDKLMAYLASLGLEPIKARGEVFDTDFHEAVAQIPAADEQAKGRVFDVVQTGYTLKGKILRYAKVVVGV